MGPDSNHENQVCFRSFDYRQHHCCTFCTLNLKPPALERENMKKKYSVFFAITLLCIFFAQAPQAVAAGYVANFSYTPPSGAAPSPAGISFTVGKMNYQTNSKPLWFAAPQFVNLNEAAKADLTEVLTAKGFGVRGPFESYDLIPYQDKKAIDFYLVPTMELSVLTPTEVYSLGDITAEVTGKLTLEAREIVTRELMWTKSIPFKKFDVISCLASIQWAPGMGRFVHDNTIMKPIVSLDMGDCLMNEIAREIEKQYPDMMTTFYTLIDPEEMGVIKKQAQELKTQKGY